ncbi:hypothetical protein RHS01_03606 [Rhizoctonia solani]|uniref:Uncharacterized protein n=1 Tax=Rhizoctonia solani TaxID=456999 RepID=A0A8H7IKI1_9AGAM|nr:hypothetical protein RHS01_03606 [Rhizoctonia solani]
MGFPFGKSEVVTQDQVERPRNFVSYSTMISGELMKRVTNSISHDIALPLAMRFHDVWLDPDCPVRQWYQLNSQVRSSTKFTSIQHCRNTRGPLFHEYLLVLLDNGDVCRIERMGEGSRNSAIKPVGCIAHDIIQWFPAPSYWDSAEFKEPNETICQVDFARSFDVLDVLAICYSIQCHETCSRYTLQRYNCYFLCLTILAVLVRRVGEWEGLLTTDSAWCSIVDLSIDSLRFKTSGELNSFQYASLEICDLLQKNDPDFIKAKASKIRGLFNFSTDVENRRQTPRDLVLEPVDRRLPSKSPASWRRNVSRALWMDDLDFEALSSSHYACIEDATNELFSSNDPLANQLAFALKYEYNEANARALFKLSSKPKFAKKVSLVLQARVKKQLYTRLHLLAYGGLQQTRRESRIPLKLNARSWICAFGIYLAIKLQHRRQGVNTKLEPAPTSASISRQVNKVRGILQSNHEPRPTYKTCRYLYLAEKESQKMTTPTPHGFKGTWDTIKAMAEIEVACQLTCDYSVARGTGSDSEKILVFMVTMTRETWISCLDIGLGFEMAESALSLISSKCEKIHMTTNGRKSEVSVDEFHNHTRARIHSHAERVGSAQLATSQLVELDICEAMTEVWRRLPRGYGGLFDS